MSQESSPGAPERDLNVTRSSSELRVLREAVNTYLYLAPSGELPNEPQILAPLGDGYAKLLAAGQPPQPPQAPLEDHPRPQVARIAPDLYAVHDWRKGKVHEGTLEDCQKVVCCLNCEAELRARASAKYPDSSPKIAAKIEAKIQRLLEEYCAAQLPDPVEQKQQGFKRQQGQGRALRL